MFTKQVRTAVPAVLLILAAGCSGDAPAAADPNTPVLARAAARSQMLVPRPLAGRCETVLAPTEVLRPGIVRQVDTGSCQLSHLGRAEFTSDKVIRLAAGTQTTEATFTAANGDVLRAVGAGTSAPSGAGRVSFTATLTFVGGTGRFAQATGQVRTEGTANLVARTASLEIVGGWIAYDASDRSGS